MASRISRSQLRTLLNLSQRLHIVRGISLAPTQYHLANNSKIVNNSINSCGWQHPVTCSREIHTSQCLDATHQLKMPSLSPTMSEGTIVKWCKKEGDPVAAGDALCEIQTDKAVVTMDHDEEGILAKILVPENTADVKVGTLIALMVDEGDDWKNVEVPADAGSPPPKAEASSAPAAAAPSSAPVPAASSGGHGGSGGGDRLVGPAVKNYLRKYGLDASKVPGSGPKGTVLKGDVLKHVLSNKLEPVAQDGSSAAASGGSKPARKAKPQGQAGPATYEDVEITSMRRTIAKRLLQSKSTIPHAYGTAQCNMKNMTAFRKRLTAAGCKVSVNDLIIKCVANALSLNPAINCVWEGNKLKHKKEIDISIAVATPTGLITPICPNAVEKDVVTISSIVKQLAAKARDGKLQPHEFMGGTFSISNLGMFGIHSFSAIINPPQCAILAVGGTSVELDEDGGTLTTSKLMLSYDASAIMEDEAVRFLAVLRNEIENVNETSMGVFDVDARGSIEQEAQAAAAAAGK